MSGRWLSIVGIGEDGRAGLSAAAIQLVEQAELLIGGRRHLDLFGPTLGEQRVWPVPLDAAIPDILARRGRPVAILASGDPFWFGAGVTLARRIPSDEMMSVPSPSSLSLAANRMAWAIQDCVVLGLNMRGLVPTLRRHLHHGAKILALSLNAATPDEVATLLVENGFGPSKITVLEALGGPRERLRTAEANSFALADIDPLNLMAIEVIAGPNAAPLPWVAGLSDDCFENDGQLTKREVRAVTVSALAPKPGELLWDLGTGSGSVAIEWLLSHASNCAIGIERDPARAARAVRNAVALGVPQFDVRQGSTPEALVGLPTPDAIFIGGGANEDSLAKAWAQLKPGGRLVVNSVTLETEAALIGARATFGGSLTRISIERADDVGTRTGWRAAMPVVQWVAWKARGPS
jgi:precorrin-6B C5,15-methyltransferase / cobalt-precorrin-6B C5,C15-methyltransferase